MNTINLQDRYFHSKVCGVFSINIIFLYLETTNSLYDTKSLRCDLLTGYGWITVNRMDSLQLLKRANHRVNEMMVNNNVRETTAT